MATGITGTSTRLDVPGHLLWREQLQKLHSSIRNLSDTNPANIMEHFFTQALETEFANKTNDFRSVIKKMMILAVQHPTTSSPRSAAATIIAQVINECQVGHFCLSDIRNQVVFQIYCQCGVTIDTYFERFSSPPGTDDENRCYSIVAHGNAVCNAEETKTLSNLLLYMQFLKRIFVIRQYLHNPCREIHRYRLNWIGPMWSAHIEEENLGALIWDLFLDIYYYNAAIMSLKCPNA
jgi:hypothetical protein